MRTTPSQELRNAVKLADQPAYRLAQQVGVSPSHLSAWLCGIVPVNYGDKRLIRLGRLVGVAADECFNQDAK